MYVPKIASGPKNAKESFRSKKQWFRDYNSPTLLFLEKEIDVCKTLGFEEEINSKRQTLCFSVKQNCHCLKSDYFGAKLEREHDSYRDLRGAGIRGQGTITVCFCVETLWLLHKNP